MTTYAPLPFARTGTVKERPDTLIVPELPVSVWPTGTRLTPAGLAYDHQGEAPVDFYQQLAGTNLVLTLDGEEYVIVDCQQNVYLPHTALLLRRSRPSGA